MLRGRVTINMTAPATSFGCIKLPLASDASIFVNGSHAKPSSLTVSPTWVVGSLQELTFCLKRR